MSGIKKYIKRGIKYIVSEHRQPIVKVEVCQKQSKDVFKDKVYIVTGGGSGLGAAIAKRLIDDGAIVIITGRNLEKLKKEAEKLGKNADYIACDVCEVEKLKKLIDDVSEKYGRIDGLINNAGVSLHEWDFLKVTEDGFETQINTNLRGGYLLTQRYIRYLLDQNKPGNVLFVSSERGTMCDDLPYGLTKRAIDSLVEALSYRYYKEGIRINAIAPGVTATNMTGIDKNADLYSKNISGRVFVPEEVAEVASFLLSDYSKCISGQIIHTNGGNHIKRGY